MTCIRAKVAFIAASFSVACSHRDYCAELNKQTTNGVILSTDAGRCEQLLDFAKDVENRYDMTFKDWFATVSGQGIAFTGQAPFALTRTGWTPTSFQAEPSQVPCAPGIATSDATWQQSPLLQFFPSRPDRLYVSMSLDVSGDVATIRATQDFNCDGVVGVNELVGHFKQGLDPIGGGWKVISSHYPEIDE